MIYKLSGPVFILTEANGVMTKYHYVCFIYFSDRMAEITKKELDIKDFEMKSTVEDTCFVNIPEDEIKMENIEVLGKFKIKILFFNNQTMAWPAKK